MVAMVRNTTSQGSVYYPTEHTRLWLHCKNKNKKNQGYFWVGINKPGQQGVSLFRMFSIR
jgi:hypothetical protein